MKNITLLTVLLISLNVNAQKYKYVHYLTGASLNAVTFTLLNSTEIKKHHALLIGMATGIIVGVTKEFAYVAQGRRFNGNDFFMMAMGSVHMSMPIGVMLVIKNDKAKMKKAKL